MKIEIPSNVQFRVLNLDSRWDISVSRPVCFRHAVTRALAGDRVESELIARWGECEDCDEGKP